MVYVFGWPDLPVQLQNDAAAVLLSFVFSADTIS